MKPKHQEICLALALLVVVVSAFATTWTQTTNMPGGSISMSPDGRIICVAPSTSPAAISTNWGQTWTISTNSPPWNSPTASSVAISADNTKIFLASAATAGNSHLMVVFASTDFGNTWAALVTNRSAAFFGGAIACSADGTKIVAGPTGGPMYYSTNTGINWYTSSVPAVDWISAASSANGRLMVATANSGSIYFSTNFGTTWTSNLPPQFWASVCISSDGKWVGATGTNTYISSNAGGTWLTNTISGNSIACSADGRNWIIAGSAIFTSSDGGISWQTNLSQSSWYESAVSADACEFMVVGYTRGNWIGRNTPSPQLSIQPADQSVNLSWLIPSTNFVLQQSSDLTTTNWTDVSNSQVLNFTNLQQQVSVPSSSTNSFFRLIAR